MLVGTILIIILSIKSGRLLFSQYELIFLLIV